MNEGSNPLASALGFWMMIQLVSTLTLLLGGLYALFCLSRAASGLDRLASAVEDLVARNASSHNANLPGPMPLATPLAPMPSNMTPSNPMPSNMTPPVHSGETPFSTPPISAATTSASSAPVASAPPAWTPTSTSVAASVEEKERGR